MRDRLTPVDLSLRYLIYPANKPIPAVYFPIDAVVSMVSDMEGAMPVEVLTVGREGMAGLPVFLGVTASPNLVFAQVAGRALRMSTDDLRDVLARGGVLHRQLHRYTQATMVQLAQNVACNRLHTTEQRAARWLLMTADRVGDLRFSLTQEFLAQMLGVRRATVSNIAQALQDRGLVKYSRGDLTVEDRAALEEVACDCYRIVREEFDRLTARG